MEESTRTTIGTNTTINFTDECNYAAARSIMRSLVKKKLLTPDEASKMDKLLREQFSPMLTALIADYPAY